SSAWSSARTTRIEDPTPIEDPTRIEVPTPIQVPARIEVPTRTEDPTRTEFPRPHRSLPRHLQNHQRRPADRTDHLERPSERCQPPAHSGQPLAALGARAPGAVVPDVGDDAVVAAEHVDACV